jgi:hypothetical protein
VDIAEDIAGVKLKRSYNLSAPKEKTMAWIEKQILEHAAMK